MLYESRMVLTSYVVNEYRLTAKPNHIRVINTSTFLGGTY